MENEEKKINKTHFVRDVLDQIGAFGKNCPDDWHHQVVQALQNAGISMHPNAIYGVRQKTLDKLKQVGRNARQGKRQLSGAMPDLDSTVKLTVADLFAFQQFAKSFGGIDKVKNAIKAMEALNQ